MPPNPTDPPASSTSTSPQTDWTSTFFKQEDLPRRYRSIEVITGAFARTLVEKAGLVVPTATEEEEKLTILDNGCGIGAVAAALHEMLDEGRKKRMELTCGDFAPGMLEALKERISEGRRTRWLSVLGFSGLQELSEGREEEGGGGKNEREQNRTGFSRGGQKTFSPFRAAPGS